VRREVKKLARQDREREEREQLNYETAVEQTRRDKKRQLAEMRAKKLGLPPPSSDEEEEVDIKLTREQRIQVNMLPMGFNMPPMGVNMLPMGVNLVVNICCEYAVGMGVNML
jgi:hypothetical protein